MPTLNPDVENDVAKRVRGNRGRKQVVAINEGEDALIEQFWGKMISLPGAKFEERLTHHELFIKDPGLGQILNLEALRSDPNIRDFNPAAAVDVCRATPCCLYLSIFNRCVGDAKRLVWRHRLQPLHA